MALQVTDNVPYGNVCAAKVDVSANTASVHFSASPHGGLEALWFCFCINNDGRDALPAQMKLVLNNPQNTLAGAPWTRFQPVIRYAGSDWERLPQGVQVDLPDGRVRILWEVNTPESTLDVAFCYPYGIPEVEALIADTGGYWQRDDIGVSQNDRPLIRLSNAYGSPDGKRPGLYILARQHSGETPGSWVLDGFLRHVAAHPEQAPLIWVMPLVHIDGIIDGDYGKDPHPRDLNKAWYTPFRNAMRFEIQAIERDIALWAGRCNPLLGLDFHAPGGTECDGQYAYILSPTHFPDGHEAGKRWATMFGKAAGDFAAPDYVRFTTGDNYFSRWGTAEKAPRFGEYLAEVHGLDKVSFETPYGRCGDTVMTREHYQQLGQMMVAGLLHEIRAR